MENEMIERVSKAIYAKWEDRPNYAKLQMNGILAEELARAAIEAMRNPTPEMVRVGVVDILDGPGISAFRNWPDLVESRHRMMIDAALAAPPVGG